MNLNLCERSVIISSQVLATDMPPDGQQAAGWAEGNQYAAGKDVLYMPGIVERQKFDSLVSFQFADMNK